MTEILTLNFYIITINPFKDEIFNISKNKHYIYYFKTTVMLKRKL